MSKYTFNLIKIRRFGDLSRNNLSIPLELLNLSYSRTIEENFLVKHTAVFYMDFFTGTFKVKRKMSGMLFKR